MYALLLLPYQFVEHVRVFGPVPGHLLGNDALEREARDGLNQIPKRRCLRKGFGRQRFNLLQVRQRHDPLQIGCRIFPLQLANPGCHLLDHAIDLALHRRVELHGTTKPLCLQHVILRRLRVADLTPDRKLDVGPLQRVAQVVALEETREGVVVVRLHSERIMPRLLKMMVQLRPAKHPVNVPRLRRHLPRQPGQRHLPRARLGALLHDTFNSLRYHHRFQHL
mmetsp:Transcript_4906/g.14213  ORF Transcript_4906/g.14213 Transcript_4906/m.14213 type:complete len:223 (-) Transcript_4906:703-1371(-)